VYRAGDPLPNASTNNFVAGDGRVNLVLVRPSAGGEITVYNASNGTVTLTVDTVGYFQSGGLAFVAIDPIRPLDTRSPAGSPPVAAGAFVETQIRGFGGLAGVPDSANVKAVIVNVAAIGPAADGTINVSPSGGFFPVPTFTHPANENVANLVIVPIGVDGKIRLRNVSSGTTHLIVDITGYFTD
jgi:hypothetical protein